MFSFFKKKPPAAPSKVQRPGPPPIGARPAVRVTSGYSRPGFLERIPAPQATEVHDESVWDEWEQSQMELDSRMGPLSVFESVKLKDQTPSQMPELDPFGTVRKRD